ncbi:hypothetical protein RIR_jg26789.t1 [Rhizophagus irregularis DAOM 181602=DAOM 197198]|uniref:Uncharacterized protein n=1 Tax=Rhizophagus irregularis (strain DAOM 197198w) TaxID=1432141 RepID=A0A015JTU0_RHIIW|nr:hypothetical protein RirG_197540 [Rhizophagus irregularis DAOM 197198w]GET57211.1 hypothetical protein RIR_jg26789.t1 [Rhizophagus irregularis DAOM 181602=DAOM 197198]
MTEFLAPPDLGPDRLLLGVQSPELFYFSFFSRFSFFCFFPYSRMFLIGVLTRYQFLHLALYHVSDFFAALGAAMSEGENFVFQYFERRYFVFYMQTSLYFLLLFQHFHPLYLLSH